MFSRLGLLTVTALLTLTGILFAVNLNHHARSGARDFQSITRDSVDVLDARMRTYLLSIGGTAAFVAATREVTKENFRVYTDGLDIPEILPSTAGIGLIVEVSGTGIDEFLRRMRLEVDPALGYVAFLRKTSIILSNIWSLRTRMQKP